MSQHYLKYHFKSLIKCTNNADDDSNGNNGKDIDTDVLNGNSTGYTRYINAVTPISTTIRITENPLN